MPDSVTIPTLHTERLVLRAFEADDAESMVSFFADPISKFYGGPLDAEDAWRRFGMYPGHWFLRGYGPWAIELRETGEYLGLTGLWYPKGWIEPEITWALVPAHHGHGYATEAAGAALTAAYEMFGWTTAVSVIATANAASIGVAERLGAVREREITYRYGDAYLYRHRAPTARERLAFRDRRELVENADRSDRADRADEVVESTDGLGRPRRPEPGDGSVSLRGLRPGDLGWVIQRHGAVYCEEFGWNTDFEALVATIAADYHSNHKPGRENAWIAEVNGVPAGCVFCCERDEHTAQLRILLVEQWARGRHVGSRLVDECLAFARSAGYTSITLWTNDVLVAARRIYQQAGFRLVDEEPHHSFGHDLIGQYWTLDLTKGLGPGPARPEDGRPVDQPVDYPG